MNEAEHLYAGGRVDYNYKKEIVTSSTFGLLCSDPLYENTILCIDSHMSGLGSGSCGPHLIDKYRVE